MSGLAEHRQHQNDELRKHERLVRDALVGVRHDEEEDERHRRAGAQPPRDLDQEQRETGDEKRREDDALIQHEAHDRVLDAPFEAHGEADRIDHVAAGADQDLARREPVEDLEHLEARLRAAAVIREAIEHHVEEAAGRDQPDPDRQHRHQHRDCGEGRQRHARAAQHVDDAGDKPQRHHGDREQQRGAAAERHHGGELQQDRGGTQRFRHGAAAAREQGQDIDAGEVRVFERMAEQAVGALVEFERHALEARRKHPVVGRVFDQRHQGVDGEQDVQQFFDAREIA